MRCPSCLDDYEPHVATCADCGVPLVPDDAVAAPPASADALLGTFDPRLAPAVTAVLERRAVAHAVVERDDEVEIRVDPEFRDDLRAELSMNWAELVRRADPDVAGELLAAGGSAPGWFDPPRGGHVDRAGRLVVDVGASEERELDGARMVGPLLLTVGAVLGVLGWYVLGSGPVALAGGALAVLGVLLPR